VVPKKLHEVLMHRHFATVCSRIFRMQDDVAHDMHPFWLFIKEYLIN